jgi:hypothetical protein
MNIQSMLIRSAFLCFLSLFSSGAVLAADKHSVSKADSHAIEHVMKHTFDKPEAPLKVAPVSVEGDFAVAGWLQDGRGGRALLQKRHGQWVITVCAGDGLKQVDTLVQTGMKPEVAKRLAAKVAAHEARLPAETLKKFASFEGMLRVDGDAAHGHGHGHAAPMTENHKH